MAETILFEISNFLRWNLFVIWYLLFGAYIKNGEFFLIK